MLPDLLAGLPVAIGGNIIPIHNGWRPPKATGCFLPPLPPLPFSLAAKPQTTRTVTSVAGMESAPTTALRTANRM